MIPYKNHKPPLVDETVYQAMHSVIAGKVTIEKNASVWFGAVLRGDDSYITIGQGTNIQDNTTVHVGRDIPPTLIGEMVTVGHNCIIHGCILGDYSIIGMGGSTILDGAQIGKNSIVGANSLVTMNKKFPDGVLIMGSPAKVIRDLTPPEEIESIEHSAKEYMSLAKDYMNN